MPIRYYLQENAIATNPKDLKARTLPFESLDHEAILQSMLKMGSTITEADIRAVLTAFYTTVARKVAEGHNVNLPIANFSTSITGIFDSPADLFDADRHKPKATVTPGKLMRQMIGDAAFEKTSRQEPKPELSLFVDINSGVLNHTVSANGIGQLVGLFLDFNPANEAEGLYFKSANGTEFKVTQFSQRTKRKLVFLIPAIPAGNYELELRKNFGTAQTMLRKGILDAGLIVG